MQPPSSPPDTTLPPPEAPTRTDGPYLPPAQPRLATPTLPPAIRVAAAAGAAAPTLPAPSSSVSTTAVGVPSVATLEALVSFDTELHVHSAPPPHLLTAPPITAPEEKPAALTTVIPSVVIPPVTPISLGGAAPIKLFDPARVRSSDDEETPVPSATMPTYKAWVAEQQHGAKGRKRPVAGKGSTSLGGKVLMVVVIGVVAAIGLFAWRQLSGGDSPAPTPNSPAAVSTTVAGG